MNKRKLIRLIILLTLLTAAVLIAKVSPSPQSNLKVWVATTKERCGKLQEKEALDKCYRSILREAVKKVGTAKTVQILELLRAEKVIDAKFDDHQHVHEIGRETAKLSEMSLKGFLGCPTTYNYGCHHGFFEYTLSQTDSYEEAATKICENTKGQKPKLYAYCYHGVGHGLMMALAYNLDKSLDICNKLPSETAIQSCWQGTFMENSNLAVDDQTKVRGFSASDPLAPCNKVEERYVWQCYINHAGYLMKVTNLNLAKAVELCLSSPNNGTKPCIQSIGLMTTNPIWQKSIKGVNTINDQKKNVEIAWELCDEMVPEAKEDCVIGAVGNILNFDETNINRVKAFCDVVSVKHKSTCFTEIGKQVVLQVPAAQQAISVCSSISDQDDRSLCENGAKLSSTSTFPKMNITPDEENLLINDNQFLKNALNNFGPSQVIEKLSVIMPQHNLICHDRAHQAGRFSYQIFGPQAFRLCSSQCHSGCYHGAAEAFFKDKGTAKLQQNLSLICQGQPNRFFSHQCIHGVGHGLMAWSNYELFEALSTCDQLDGVEAQTSCHTGVFMENIVGGLSVENAAADFGADRHFTKYLNQDPHYPCNIVEKKYKGSCYFLQTSRMIQLFQADFQKIAQACSNTPIGYQKDCFQSMGRDVGGNSKHNVRLATERCNFAPFGQMRAECLAGAVQDTFWDPTGQGEALEFCSQVKDSSELERCYQTIALRGSEVLKDKALDTFCKKIPVKLQYLCQKEAAIVYTQSSISTNPAPTSFTTQNQSQITIKMTDKGLDPKDVKIKKGTRVIFVNKDDDLRWPASNIHPTHSIYPEFDPQKPIKSESSWQFTFDKIGVWRFHDHLISTFTGSITVE